jgi:hypothetical protein
MKSRYMKNEKSVGIMENTKVQESMNAHKDQRVGKTLVQRSIGKKKTE